MKSKVNTDLLVIVILLVILLLAINAVAQTYPKYELPYKDVLGWDAPEGIIVYQEIDTTAILFQYFYDDGGMTGYERDRYVDMMFADGYMTIYERKRVVDYMLYYGREYEKTYPVRYYDVVMGTLEEYID